MATKAGLTADGLRVLKVLTGKYGMTEPNALKLMTDGGAALAIALLSIVR